jgi:protein-tyrosine phosphatase
MFALGRRYPVCSRVYGGFLQKLIDTHSHLLPGVDHGCPDLETSLQMASAAAASGISTVVCTPHLPDWDERHISQVQAVLEEVRSALAVAGTELTLLLGFEVDLSVASMVGKKELEALTIEGSNGAILLEMPYSGWPVFMEDMVFRLATTGFRPVLAHPERNDRIQRSSDLLVGCIKAGAVAQGTAASLTGEFGRSPAQTLRRLLSEGNIRLLSSDAHAYRRDGWTMEAMMAELADCADADSLALLTRGNPARLLAGESPLAVRVAGKGGTRSWRPRRRYARGTL